MQHDRYLDSKELCLELNLHTIYVSNKKAPAVQQEVIRS